MLIKVQLIEFQHALHSSHALSASIYDGSRFRSGNELKIWGLRRMTRMEWLYDDELINDHAASVTLQACILSQ